MHSRVKIPLLLMGIGGVIAGILLLILFLAVDRQALDLWIDVRRPYELLLVAMVVPLVTLLHELGHLIVGLVIGKSFQAFYVKPLLLENADGVRVRFLWRSPVGGFVRLAPPRRPPSRKLKVACIIGGPAANIATGIFLLPFLKQPLDAVRLMALCLCIFSFIAGVASMVPVRDRNGLASDGLRLYELLWRERGTAQD